MKKKILASVLAVASMASLAASVSAATPDQTDLTNGAAATILTDAKGGYGSKIDASATVNVPTLTITAPGSTVVRLNPYRVKVQLNGEETQASVLNQAMEFTNASVCDVLITVTPTATAKGSAALLKAAPTAESIKADTKKSVYLFLAASDDSHKEDVIAADYATKPIEVDEGETGMTITPFDGKAHAVASIPAKADGDNGVAYVKVGGWVNSNPKEAWTSSDSVSVSLVYNFSPAVDASAPEEGTTAASA